MRVVGLISGGKDSIWNLHYCAHFGHELVCLANLAPPAGVNELDSYMYQTVGWDLIDAIAVALGLPLIRRIIQGKPMNTSSQSYMQQDGDEVEDLTQLLEDVMRTHPGVQAVSCGAILSNYQRLRVESVCARLGLKVLAFMWMQDQTLLLKQMIDGQLDARIVKVASMGLENKHVGESILNPNFSSYILKLGEKWGVHVCGEGGEYETAVVDAPLYTHKVHIQEADKVSHADGGDVVYLRVNSAGTEPKETARITPKYTVLEQYSSLRYYQSTFSQLKTQVKDLSSESQDLSWTPTLVGGSVSSTPAASEVLQLPRLARVGPYLATSSLDLGTFGKSLTGEPAEQCETLLSSVALWLQSQYQLKLEDAVFAEVQVRDLSCFESVNAAYAHHFNVDPPPRVCIQTPLPEGMHLRVRLLLKASSSGNVESNKLRVQSISTWAMACIGPYSQAFQVGQTLMSAGVIGLVPHTMTMPSVLDASKAAIEPEEAEDTANEKSMEQWEAELWMLMRSLRNVLIEMGSSFGEVSVAHIYTSGVTDFQAVSNSVLEYMKRDCEDIKPLTTCTQVPRLPKDGKVEVNVICDKGYQIPCSRMVVVCQGDDCCIEGTVELTVRRMSGMVACSAEFATGTGKSEISCEEAVYMIQRCINAAKGELIIDANRPSTGINLQVQYTLLCAHDFVSTAAEEAARELLKVDASTVACMPVLSLGPQVCLRILAFGGSE